MRAALFAPASADDPAMGSLVETAIFAQWFHYEHRELRYARWQRGEVDIVPLDATLRPKMAIEVKWSDRYFKKPSELKSLFSFCQANGLPRARVTTRTESGHKNVDGVEVDFLPAAVYCYAISLSILVDKQLTQQFDKRFGLVNLL